MQTVETSQEIASFKPKLFSLSYKLAERKEKRDLQQLSEMFPDSKFAVEFNESYGQHQHNNNNNISSNRDLTRSFSVDMSQLTVEELDHGLQQAELNLEAATDATIMSPQELKQQQNNNNKSPTSKSLGSVSGLTASGTSMLSKHEKLFSNALLLQKKKEKLMEDVKKQEYAECTFHPVRQAKHYRPKKTHTNVSHNNVPLDTTDEMQGGEDEEEQEESLQDTRITADGDRGGGGGGRLNKAEVKMILDELNNNPFSPDTQRRLETMDIGDAFYEPREEGEEDQKEAKEEDETNKDEPEMHEIDHSISKLSDISDPLVHSPPPPPPPSTDEQHHLHDLPAVILNSKNKSNTRNKKGQDTISSESNSLPPPLPAQQPSKSGKRRSENSHKPVSESKEGKSTDKKAEEPRQQHQQPPRDEDLPVYDRLYAYKDHTPKALSEHQPSYLRELQQCTFQPNLSNTKNNLSLLKAKMSKHPPPSSDQQIEGFSKTVDRMRKIISDKERKKIEESDETLRKIAEEKYVKSRKLAQRGQQPFHSHLDERIVKQQQEKQLHAPDTSKPE
jgi:hypothetical protein